MMAGFLAPLARLLLELLLPREQHSGQELVPRLLRVWLAQADCDACA